MLVKVKTIKTIGRDGRGGGKGRHRRLLVPHYKMHSVGENKGIRNGVGKRKDGNESMDGGRTVGTEKKSGG